MLNIVTVNAGNYEGRGAEYVNILFDMVRRNLSDKFSFNFICFTDDPKGLDAGIKTRTLPGNLEGWWNKLYLFKEGLFDEGDRVLYFDLDTVLVGGIDDIAKYDGEFAILEDFYRPGGLQSSVMAWKAGFDTGLLWRSFKNEEFPNLQGGDQEWIEHVWNYMAYKPQILQDLYPYSFVSYKVSCRNIFPKNSKVIVFHGHPRPHEVITGWIPQVWKIGGGTSLELEIVCNTENDQLIKNIQYACGLSRAWLEGNYQVNDKRALIIGGGSSLKNNIKEIKIHQENGAVIFATNNTWKFLLDNGIEPDYHVMSDARPENAKFIPEVAGNKTKGLYASQCDASVFNARLGITIWHPMHDGIKEVIGDDARNYAVVGCGSTTGLKSIGIAFIMGFRKFDLYGFDSSYEEGAHHAYKQPLNDSSKIIEVIVNGQKFQTSPWMVTQTDEFKELAKILINDEGCEIAVHGNGLLPYVAYLIGRPAAIDTEMVEIDGLWWPSKDTECRKAALNEMGDLDKIITLCKKRGLAVQAGGNVGVWALRLSKDFKEILTFEPDNLNHECLEKNTSGQENIFSFHAALGESYGVAALERNPNNAGAHYIKAGEDFEVMTIDSFNLKECDLIQLDIEGYELKALKGAINTIKKFHPVIVIEDKNLGKRYNDNAVDWLKSHNYTQVARLHKDSVFVHKAA